jgi:hypothetical protein
MQKKRKFQETFPRPLYCRFSSIIVPHYSNGVQLFPILLLWWRLLTVLGYEFNSRDIGRWVLQSPTALKYKCTLSSPSSKRYDTQHPVPPFNLLRTKIHFFFLSNSSHIIINDLRFPTLQYSTGQNIRIACFWLFFYNSKHGTQIRMVIRIVNEVLYKIHFISKFHQWFEKARFLNAPIRQPPDPGRLYKAIFDNNILKYTNFRTEGRFAAVLTTFFQELYELQRTKKVRIRPDVTRSRFFTLPFQYLNGMKPDKAEIFTDYVSRISLHVLKFS